MGESASWLYHKSDGRNGNGEAGGFSEAGKEELREALCDIAERLRRAAERI